MSNLRPLINKGLSMYFCSMKVLRWLSCNFAFLSGLLGSILGLHVLMILLISCKVLHTCIPFPRLVFSPGLTIHIFLGILNSSSSDSSVSSDSVSSDSVSSSELVTSDLIILLLWCLLRLIPSCFNLFVFSSRSLFFLFLRLHCTIL